MCSWRTSIKHFASPCQRIRVGSTVGRRFVSTMKTCSKCKRELDESRFWKHTNKAGIYPSCKECEKRKSVEAMASDPMCVRCKTVPHTPKSYYCTDCSRAVQKKPSRKWISRRTGLEWCKVCESKPRLSYHHYCRECKREYDNKRRAKKWRDRYNTRPKLQRATARGYATGLLQRGKIKRKPCVFCGAPGVAFHHYDYLPKTRNFEDVCRACHDDAHRFLKIMLTLIKAGAIHLPVA